MINSIIVSSVVLDFDVVIVGVGLVGLVLVNWLLCDIDWCIVLFDVCDVEVVV